MAVAASASIRSGQGVAAIAGVKLLSYHLDYSVPIRLRTDACDIGAGAMLDQVADGH